MYRGYQMWKVTTVKDFLLLIIKEKRSTAQELLKINSAIATRHGKIEIIWQL